MSNDVGRRRITGNFCGIVPQDPVGSTLYVTGDFLPRGPIPGRTQEGFLTVAHSQAAEPTRRDFIYVATGAAGAAAVVMSAVPIIDQMNPSADVLALSTTDVDISAVMPGQVITVVWRSKPVFVRRLTPEEVTQAEAVPLDNLIDDVARNDNLPSADDAKAADRYAGMENGLKAEDGKTLSPEWLIVVGICTHLGCIPIAHRGDYGGWQCPCHGSQYDVLGRVRQGPAPQNLAIPPYTFVSDTTVRIG